MKLPKKTDFDYKSEKYRYDERQVKLPDDNSILTFKGHYVYNRDIRCNFSPVETTG